MMLIHLLKTDLQKHYSRQYYAKNAVVGVGEVEVWKIFPEYIVALRLESTKFARGSGMKLHLF
jgi:hypothetical protein